MNCLSETHGKSQVKIEYRMATVRVEAVVIPPARSECHYEQRAEIQKSLFNIQFRRTFWTKIPSTYQSHRSGCHRSPQGDAGLTGRKIIVDTYGGYAPHGGGAFSARIQRKLIGRRYMARYVAKNIGRGG